MTQEMQMWAEILFNLAYLVTIWGFVIAMIRRQTHLSSGDWSLRQLLIWAFALLAVGDTGHIGFRVIAYAMGDLGTRVTILGRDFGLVGMGALSTAITVTFFYMLMVGIWQERYQRGYGWLGGCLFVAAGVRLVLMTFPANEWDSVVPPQSWSLYRNLPLIVQGVGVAYLMLRDGIREGDAVFKWIGGLILVSYGFYLPVILFVQQVPLIGMLMIPKTMAYVGIAWLGYVKLFSERAVGEGRPRR